MSISLSLALSSNLSLTLPLDLLFCHSFGLPLDLLSSVLFHIHILLFLLKIPFLFLNCPTTILRAFNALNLIADQNSHLSLSAQNINWIYHVAFIDELSRALLCMLHILPQQKPTNNTNIWLTTESLRWGGLWPRPQPTAHTTLLNFTMQIANTHGGRRVALIRDLQRQDRRHGQSPVIKCQSKMQLDFDLDNRRLVLMRLHQCVCVCVCVCT